MGRKREKRKDGATQEKAAGTELRRILLVMKITFGAKRTGEERKPRGATLFAGAGCALTSCCPNSQIIQKILPHAESLEKIANTNSGRITRRFKMDLSHI